MRGQGKNSIVEVAAAAGTSAMTVTRAFNNSGRIAPKTRDRILKVAKELGYQPNFFARGLRGRRTKSVGLLMSMGGRYPINGKVRTITVKLYEAGYVAYTADSFSDVGIIVNLLKEFLLRKIDALFFQTAFRFLAENKRIKELLAEIPSVLIESFWRLDTPHDQLILDRTATMREIARHFLDSGRRKTIVIAPEGEGSAEAIDVFRQVMRGGGIAPMDNMLAGIDTGAVRLPFGEVYVDALRRSFPDLKGFDSIWCSTDDGAAAVIRHLAANGVSVPRDVAVVGYHNSEICFYTDPPLASVDTRDAKASELEAWMLLDRINNPDKPPMAELVAMPFARRTSAG